MGEMFEFLNRLEKRTEEVITTIRSGFDGLKEVLKSHFFFTRDVYTRRAIPKINEVVASHATVDSSTAANVKFETDVDRLLIYAMVDIKIDTSPAMLESMILHSGEYIELPLRTKQIYVRSVGATGEFYIWGMW